MRREGIAAAKEASIERTDSEDSQNFCEAALTDEKAVGQDGENEKGEEGVLPIFLEEEEIKDGCDDADERGEHKNGDAKAEEDARPKLSAEGLGKFIGDERKEILAAELVVEPKGAGIDPLPDKGRANQSEAQKNTI